MRARLWKVLLVCALRGHVPRPPPNAVSVGADPQQVMRIIYPNGETFGVCACARCGLLYWRAS